MTAFHLIGWQYVIHMTYVILVKKVFSTNDAMSIWNTQETSKYLIQDTVCLWLADKITLFHCDSFLLYSLENQKIPKSLPLIGCHLLYIHGDIVSSVHSEQTENSQISTSDIAVCYYTYMVIVSLYSQNI